MTIRQLTYFQSVADSRSFTKAAKECYVSQTAISRQIQALEEELGVQLLVRNTVRVRLTPAGEYFFRQCRKILADVRGTVSRTQEIAREKAPRLTLAVPGDAEQQAVMRPLRSFRRKYPELEVQFMRGIRQELINELVEEKADVLIAQNFDLPDLAGLQVLSFLKARLMLMMSPEHPLSHEQCVCPEQLKGETLAAAKGSATAPTVERARARNRQLGLEEIRELYVEDFPDVVLAVESGSAAALVPSNLQGWLPADLHFAELSGPSLPVEFVALCLPDSVNTNTKLFFDFLEKYYAAP